MSEELSCCLPLCSGIKPRVLENAFSVGLSGAGTLDIYLKVSIEDTCVEKCPTYLAHQVHQSLPHDASLR